MAKSGMPALDSTTLLIIVVIVVVIIFVVYFFNKERESFSEKWEYFADYPQCSKAPKCDTKLYGKTCTDGKQDKTCGQQGWK